MPLLHIPDDILANIASHLPEADAVSLVRALVVEGPLSIGRPDLVDRIPSSLRRPWMLYDTVSRMEAMLRDYAELALYATSLHLSSSICICIFDNWTVFTPKKQDNAPTTLPMPVAEFSWTSVGRSQVLIHRPAILNCIVKSAEAQTCRVHLSAYKMSRGAHSSAVFLSHHPFLQTDYAIMPMWVAKAL